MEWIGIRIRRQRRRIGLSIGELAAQAGISKPYLSVIETGKTHTPPSDEILERLSEVLKLPEKLLLMHARFWQTPIEVRVILQELVSGRDENKLLCRAVRELLMTPDNAKGTTA